MNRNTWLLIKVQLKNLFFHKRKKGTRGGMAGMLIAAAAILYVDAVYNWMLYSSVDPAHYYAVPQLLVTVGIVCVFMFGVNSAQGELFGFKDFDMLMSLPVSAESIFVSKISTFMILEYLYSALFVIPTMIIYGVMANASFVFYIFACIGFIFLPMLPAALASLIALGIRKLTSKMKNKNFFNNLFQIILICAIFAFSFGMNGMNDAAAANMFISAADSITRYFPFADWYVMGSIHANLFHLLLFCVLNLAAFAALIMLFSKSFVKINLAGKQGYHVRNFRLRRKNKNTQFMALFKKELNKYFSNFMYVMNMSIGQIMLLIGAVYLLFIQKTVNDFLVSGFGESGIISYGALLLALICGLMAHLSCTTSCSISLEGKFLWITKTLPVSTNKIFASKILVNLCVILIPTLLAYGIIAVVFSVPLVIACLAFIYIIAAALFVSMGGLTINLFFPKLVFDREIIVIKQSASTFISIVGGMLIGGLAVFLFANFAGSVQKAQMVFSIITAVYAVADIVLFIYLRSGGRNRFYKLG